MVEPTIDDQIPTNRIGYRPKITNGIRREIRLREMPQFTGYRELLQRVRNRECLRMLRPPCSKLSFLSDDEVDVEVEASHVVTQQNRTAVSIRSDVQLRSRALIQAPYVTH